ncbi:TetR/AcrR family transcriptional regulator [Heyndrickxia oleronia]|jgi:AcrR family transcriptional regulator|uniref:TetR/AcrR family transcriptional regulator n=1 Tax=Heyndrickxia oleronia TaxID=38875 RepID=UPI00242CD40A|nr:TetR/AcrR family transcriptional regulator [Heyndrickxia oleronia]MCI1590924.1 TetR/AcrR family transcriptional regulator [Heyndrickxia oleronia]MCI1612947.1 TetR/AcrR family transcriptional regulator [Heyndrickxia oleronia]MCI1744173.1 TetR/AcrR family transcriptional regulator [Heyndrickxia oleronia]MCI1760784.1 TetR/AcrR family transcriptional regulator [Heyndrickxia oleronia]
MIDSDKNLDKRVRRTKLQLKQAFIKLMEEKNYDQITVTDIVNRADYNRATFYRHYNFKEELAEEMITDKTTALLETFKYPYKNNNMIHLNSLSSSDIIVFDHIMENKDFYKLWRKFQSIPGFEESFLQSIVKFIKKDITLLTPHDPHLDNNLYTTFYANGILGLILDWIKNGLEPHPDYMAKQLVKIINYYPAKSYISAKGNSPTTYVNW